MLINSKSLNLKQIYWLIGGLFAALLPLLGAIPWWIMLLFMGLFGWRVQYQRQRISRINKIGKLLLVLLSTGVLYLTLDKLFSVQGFVSLLSLAACLKLLELERRRDYLLLVFLGCFISASQLLFSSSLVSFGYVVLCLIVFHACLYIINSSASVLAHAVNLPSPSKIGVYKRFKKQSRYFRKMSVLFLQAMPIAVVLFIVMPRIGSIWKVPLNTNIAKTGVSDSLSAGDIAQLNQDYSVAMRITFQSDHKPDNKDLYWRGVILSAFDGKTWRRVSRQEKELDNTKKEQLKQHLLKNVEQAYSYQVMLERTGRRWLYGLNTSQIKEPSVTQWQNYQYTRSAPVLNRYQYSAKSSASYLDVTPLSEQAYRFNTALSNARVLTSVQLINPKTQAYAKQLAIKHPQPEQLINALLKKFSKDFVYTLAPGQSAQNNPIDDFLFDQKRGYCEHFASSTAYLLRAAGIPARVVAGYQGGQWSSDQSYLLVTQAEAHAWVEVWLENKGWVTLDPTAAVAPQRIERGATDFLPQLLGEQNVFAKFNQFSLIRKMRLNWDNANYQWHKWVLNYDNTLQLSFVTKLLGGVDAWRIALLILSSLMVVLIALMISIYWRANQQPKDSLLICVKRLEKKLANVNIHREKGESISQLLQRAAIDKRFNRSKLAAIEKRVNHLLYKKAKDDLASDVAQLNKLIKQLTVI